MTVAREVARRVAKGPALIDKAREAHPLFAGEAARGEAKGRLTEETIAALRDNGFLGMWIPRCFGGSETGPVEFLSVIEQMSYSDGSTGWVLMAAQVATGTAAAYLEPGTASGLFGRGMPVIAGQGAPNGRAHVEGGGYRLTGKWSYGSGLLHSEYIHTGAVVYENGAQRMLPGGRFQDIRIFILPIEQAKLTGNWDVLGLRATGSVDYAIDNVFVPEEMSHLQSANLAVQGGNLYRLRIFGLSTIGHTGFALGVGRRILDELSKLARQESGRPQIMPQRGGGESFHEQFGLAEAKVRASRAFAFEAWRDIEATLDRGEEPDTRQITLARLALNYATSAIAEVCAFAYHYGGGVALRDGILQRCFRDMHAGIQHATTSTGILRECARELLGIAPGKVWAPRMLIDP
jgi:alkylation response protein AidB-like acyl-CoA dehydrogenase